MNSLRRFYLVGFILLLAFDTLSQVCFKLAANQALPFSADFPWVLRIVTHWWIYGAVIGYLGAFFTWMTLLEHAPIGPAFAASHLEVIGVMALSWPVFGEPITLAQGVGAACIIAGVICLALVETTVPTPRDRN
jgi:drug/metabolite transporter (DMT)-like permease